jgi:hypothetical protein
LAAASAIGLLRGAASGHKKTRFAHSSGRSRASTFAAALAAAPRAYRTLPENVTQVNYSGCRADCNALPHCLPSHARKCECAKTCAQESLLVGANGYHDFKRPKCPTHCWSTYIRHRPYADRHWCGCLCTARSPGRRTQEGTDPPKPGLFEFSNWPLRPTRPISGWNDAKLRGSDAALGTTTRFGTPSFVLAPWAANWT